MGNRATLPGRPVNFFSKGAFFPFSISYTRSTTDRCCSKGNLPEMSKRTAAPGKPVPIVRHASVKWTPAEWLLVTCAIMDKFPDLGLPNPQAVSRITLPHVRFAMQLLPEHRRRNLVQLVSSRPSFISACHTLINRGKEQEAKEAKHVADLIEIEERQRKESAKPAEASPPAPANTPTPAAPALSINVPRTVVYRQPDGPDNGKPTKTRIYWNEAETYALAVELAYNDPALIDSLNNLRPFQVFTAQRVLATSRRRNQTSFLKHQVRALLAPAFRRLRLEIEAARNAAALAKTEQTRATEAGRIKASEAPAAEALPPTTPTPPDILGALGTAGIGALVEALISRFAVSAQSMIEAAVIKALTSDQVKDALASAQSPRLRAVMPANAPLVQAHQDAQAAEELPPPPPSRDFDIDPTPRLPAVSAPAHGPVIGTASPPRKLKLGLVGAMAQQAQNVKDAFPQFEFIVRSEYANTNWSTAFQSCERIFGFIKFMNHKQENMLKQSYGDRYHRVNGAASEAKRQIQMWLDGGGLSEAK